MRSLKNTILGYSMRWHRYLVWAGGLALLIFLLSGITHPLMTWTGPKAVAFFPPQLEMDTRQLSLIPSILEKNEITQAILIKLVPTERGTLLQVTEHRDRPRRYFSLETGEALLAYDQRHAVWLARYYSGHRHTPVREIHFQTEFDAAYPWVNRLLPVYRVRFDSEDNLTVFVFTELGVLGHLTNDWKNTLQSIFRLFHTWNWLDELGHVRVALMALLLLCLLGAATAGILMVVLIKNRRMEKKRIGHRLIAYVIGVPVLLFSASGLYHLLQYAYGENHRGLQLVEPIVMPTDLFRNTMEWLAPHQGIALNSVSVVAGPGGQWLYRLGIPQGTPGQLLEDNRRFDGMPIEKAALYFSAYSGEQASITDRDMAIYYAGKHLGIDEDRLSHATLVTRFGPHYDFRNRRLPVWSIGYDSELGDTVFIDPATGMLVDRLVTRERYEGYSFSILHKWNFMVPLIGRQWRDTLLLALLSLSVIGTLLGYMLLFRRIRR